eukprot:SM000306S11752  [mRNA]  locus=s306:121376:122689:- [translate_table: standard]
MRHSKAIVLTGATGALAVMTVISVVIGRLFQRVPAQLQTTLPIGEYLAVALLLYFGFRSILSAWRMPSRSPAAAPVAGAASSSAVAGDGAPGPAGEEFEELAEAQEFVRNLEVGDRCLALAVDPLLQIAHLGVHQTHPLQLSIAVHPPLQMQKTSSPLVVLWEVFSLIFVAEWGDRSMLATIALGAAQSPYGVASGAILGHFVATAIAVLGGALLSKYISEKVVGYAGGALFLLFAAATLLGFF